MNWWGNDRHHRQHYWRYGICHVSIPEPNDVQRSDGEAGESMIRRAARIVFVLSTFGLAQAQEMDLPQKPDAGSALQALELAQALALSGRENRDALTMIVAARIAKETGVKNISREPERATSPASDSNDNLSVEGMLRDALAYSRQDHVIAGIAEDIRASAAKGRTGSLARSVSTVAGAATDLYSKLSFQGAQTAEIEVRILSDGEIDVLLYDDSSNLVCRNTKQTTMAYCRWTPVKTSSHLLKVENRGRMPVRYSLTTN